MKSLLAACAAATLVLSAGAAHAEVSGVWTIPGSPLMLQIAPCGANLCGAILSTPKLKADPGAKDEKNHNPALRTRPLRGLYMLYGFKGGPAAWTGGSIYLPGNGDTYPATLALIDAVTLNLKACKGVFCKTQVLKKVR